MSEFYMDLDKNERTVKFTFDSLYDFLVWAGKKPGFDIDILLLNWQLELRSRNA